MAARNVAGREAQGRLPRDPRGRVHRPAGGVVGDTESEGLVSGRWEMTATPRASTYERPKRPGFVKVVADPERRVARRRGRGRARGGRVVPAADARDPRGGPGRRAARRDPALPHLLRGRVLSPSRSCALVIERIVVASDRSETASRAVAWAAEMARRYGAQLTIVQAFVPGPAPERGRDRARRLRRADLRPRHARPGRCRRRPGERDRRRRRGGAGRRARRRQRRA